MNQQPPSADQKEGFGAGLEFDGTRTGEGDTDEEAIFEEERSPRESSANLADTPSWIGQIKRAKTELKRYARTSGTSDGAGKRYEWKVVTLVFLRLLAKGYEFHLASNLKDAGKFDDIVVKYRKNERDAWKVTCVQLKHKENGNISLTDFLGLSGNFSLVNYCNSYESVKQNFTKETDEVDVQFILYTNAPMCDDLAEQVESDQLFTTGGQAVYFQPTSKVRERLYDLVNFKNTLTELKSQLNSLSKEEVESKIKAALESIVYENQAVTSWKTNLVKCPTIKELNNILSKLECVSSKEMYDSFLTDLCVYKNQANESELDATIKETLANFWSCGDSDEILDMANNLTDKIRSWWQRDNFFLTKDSQLWLSVQVETLSKRTLGRLTKTSFEFQKYCLQLVHDKIACSKGILNFRVDSRTAASSLKVHQALASFGAKNVNVLHVNVKALLARTVDVLSAWATRWCPVLVVECDDELDRLQAARICEEILKVLGKDGERVLVLIAPEKHEMNIHLSLSKSYSYFHDNAAWSDLTPATKERICSIKLPINGRESEATLRELVGTAEGFFNKIGLDAISQFAMDEIECGKALDEKSTFFVTRRLQSSADGVPFAVNSVCDVPGKVVLLLAEPGMGKSTLLKHLAKSAKAEHPNYWIVYINLNDCAQYLKKIDVANFDKNEVITFFEHASLTPGNSLGKLLFGLMVHKLFVFIDGVDEVFPHYEEQVFLLLNFLKGMDIVQLWVASRPILQEKLARSLQVEAHSLSPFLEQDQREFFNKFWEINVPSATPPEREAATKELLSWLTNSLGTENSILGVPLMNRMVAEKFKGQIFSTPGVERSFNTDERLDVTDLYKTFFKEKLDLYCFEKKKVQQRDVSSYQNEEEILLKRLIHNHQLAALRELLSSKEFAGLQFEYQQEKDLNGFLEEVSESREKTGIIENVVYVRKEILPKFVHRSFAEYFTASWLADNFKKNKGLTERITFDPTYKVVNEMFSRLLAEGLPLHVAVLNRNLEETKRTLISQSESTAVNVVDKGGRTAFHLAVLFSATDRHPHWIGILECLAQAQKSSLEIADKVLGWRPLQYIVRLGSLMALQLLPEKENALKPDAQTMLSAARYASVEVVNFLVKNYDGKLDCQGPNGETMVHSAAKGGNVQMLKYVSSNGLPLKVTDYQRNTALRYASPHAVPYLLENGLELEHINARGLTVLQDAAQDGDYDVVAALLASSASFEVSKSGKKLAAQRNASLLCAAFAGNFDYVQKLVRMGASVKHKDKKNKRAAIVALRQKHFEIAYWLLAQECTNGDTPLGAACRDGELKIVSFILSRGVDIECDGIQGHTPLVIATIFGRLVIAELLVEKGARLENTDKNGRPPLHHGAVRGYCDIVKLLLENGANVDYQDRGGFTALHNAAYGGQSAMAKLLLKEGASLESCDVMGWTPLYIAGRNGKNEIARLLVEKGARVKTCDNGGWIALYVATRGGENVMAKAFLKKGSTADCCGTEGWKKLYAAVLDDNYDMVRSILKKQASVESRGNDGWRALYVAVRDGNYQRLWLLMEKGVNVKCSVSNGSTPL